MSIYCGFCHRNLGEPTREEFQQHVAKHELSAVKWKKSPSEVLRHIQEGIMLELLRGDVEAMSREVSVLMNNHNAEVV